VNKLLPKLTILFLLGFFFTSYAQKGSIPTKTGSTPHINSPSCPLVVVIQDNTPSAVCSELLKTLVAVSSACTDTNAVSYQWSSSIGGVFSTLRTTTFNLPEFLVATPVTFTVLATEGSETVSASYTITVKPRPSRPSLSPFGTIILCDNNAVTLTSSVCTGGSTTIWSDGTAGATSINVPAIGGTFYKVACEKNGCVSDSTAAAALITGTVTQAPTTTSRTICEGTTITTGNGLQAQLVNCPTGQSSTHTYTGPTVGYDQGYRNAGGVDPSVVVPSTTNTVRKVSVSITWRKQKGGFQNDCGTGDFLYWPFHNETQFRVQSPSGKIVTLVYAGSYGGLDNPTITTVFEDGASPINYYSPPVSGTFAPAQPLSNFIGENPTGTWTLLPYDNYWRDPLCVSGFAITFSEIQDGNITWWDAPTGGNQVGTGAEFIPTVTAAGTYTYYAQGKCARGCPSVRTPTTLTINATPPAPVIDVNIPLVNNVRSICNGEAINLTATGCNNGGTVKWSGNIQGANFATGASYTFVPSGNVGFNANHTFTAICEGANLCRSVNSNTISLTVKYKPSIPTISGPGSTACINSNVTLTASGCSGGTVGWTGNRTGNPINFIISNNVSIKAACTINGCTGDSTTTYAISTLPKPATPNINASQVQAICIGGSVTLSSNCANGTTPKWTGGLTGSPITITPTTTRNYRVSCLGTNGCASDSSVALNIVVLPKTKPTIAGNTFVCGPSSVTLTANGCSAANETVMWRDGSLDNPYIQNITQTRTFRAVCIRNGYCVSDSSDIFTVQYRNKPSQPTITAPANTTVCQGSSVMLTASVCSGGTLGWTGGLTGSSITISALGTRTYKVACTINNCTSDSSSAVSVTVLPAPVFTASANKTSICGGESATITTTGCTGTLSWTGGATTSSITVSPTTTTTYTATCTVNNCSSTQQVTITPLQTPSVTASGVLQCNGTPVTLTATNVPSGSTIQWRKDGVDIAGATGTTYSTSVAGSYDFKVGKLVTTQLAIPYNSNLTDRPDMHFVNSNIGFILQYSIIRRTLDGGNTWSIVYSGSNINDLFFINSMVGWAVGNQQILKTVDGGNTWIAYSGSLSGLDVRRITFRDVNNGIAFTHDNKTLYTTDSGISWTVNSGIVDSGLGGLSKIGYLSASDIYVFGSSPLGNGIFKKSNNNGTTWTGNISQILLYDINFINSTDGWIVGSTGRIFKTIDGGNNWTDASNSTTPSGSLVNIDFINNQIGYLTVANNGIFKTIDGGANWTSFISDSNYQRESIFLSEDNGWYFSNDGGTVFKKISTPQCPTTPAVLTAPQAPAAPSITPLTNSTICQGSSLTLSATGCAGTYTWTGGLTSSSVSVSPAITTNYTVTCTTGNCMSANSSAVLVTVLPKPVQPTVNQTNPTICGGQNTTLSVTPINGGTYVWTGGLTGTSINVSPSVTSTYKVAVSVNGCVSDSTSVIVTVTNVNAPTITLGGEVCTNNLPTKIWDKSIATPSGSSINALIKTNDGGVFTVIREPSNTTIAKLDATGTTVWSRILNIPSGSSQINVAIATNDGGYLLAGRNNSSSIGGDVSSIARTDGTPTGSTHDFWILKIDANGVRQWDKRYGGNWLDEATDIVKSPDGGYLLGGITQSSQGGDVSEFGTLFENNYWSVKIDANGVKQWDRRFIPEYLTALSGGATLNCVQNTSDGGFLLGGYSRPPYEPINNTVQTDDYFVVKLNSTGVKQWEKLYNNNNAQDYLKSIQPTTDGGFLLAGNTSTSNGNIWLVKINANGTKQWDKQFGGSENDEVSTMIPTIGENNFLISGYSSSNIGGDKTEVSRGMSDFWIIKVKPDGTKLWDKTLGGSFIDVLYRTTFDSNDNILLGGFTASPQSGERTGSGPSAWFVKLNNNCPPQTSATIFLGDSLTLKASNCAGIVNWSNGKTGNTIIAKPTINTSYTATCTYLTCQSTASTSFNITVDNRMCESLKSGSWSDPTTWSCNRVPTATDDVFINAGHTVTENSSPIIRAKTLTYRGGILQIPQATTLRLGN
jgi:photosystem II stability/assembly factor-like uncharacterized protein